jgi:hypothetical protein
MNLFSQLSFHSNNVGKLCAMCEEASEGELENRNIYRN